MGVVEARSGSVRWGEGKRGVVVGLLSTRPRPPPRRLIAPTSQPPAHLLTPSSQSTAPMLRSAVPSAAAILADRTVAAAALLEVGRQHLGGYGQGGGCLGGGGGGG